MSKITKSGSKTIVKPEQDIVSSTAKEFREELRILIENQTKDLVIDMAGVEMVDSVGLGVFIVTQNGLSKINGKLTVTNASHNIFNLFKTMGLNRQFEVSETQKNTENSSTI